MKRSAADIAGFMTTQADEILDLKEVKNSEDSTLLTQNPDAPLIMLVEDDENHAELIRHSFEIAHEEYRLHVVNSLNVACDFIKLSPPNLILATCLLPDGDVKELILAAQTSCPVILMTSQGDEQVGAEAMKSGALDYVVKSADNFTSMSRIVRLALREWSLIKERRKVFDAISRGKREWEQTFDAVPDLIAIIDVNHTISRVNRAMADRCGLRPSDFPGRKCYEIVHGSDSPPPFCPHVLMMQNMKEHAEEISEIRLNGFFDVTVSPLYDDMGQVTGCVHVARDITERKNAEEERRKLEQQLLQAQKLESLGVLAGGIAHDFNNILTIVLGHCFMMKDDPEISNKTHVLDIEAAANRAADLCRQMLAYAGKSPLVQAQVNMWLLLDEVVNMLKSGIKKNISFELDLMRDVPPIKGDISQIQQIVMNLIINAAEAIGDKGGVIRVLLSKSEILPEQAVKDFLGNSIHAGKYARMEVTDNGCGMDDETIQRAFEPFFTTKFSGRGLGMSAILGIIKAHDGALQLSSSLGAGTSITCFFPLPNGHEIEEPATAEPAIEIPSRIGDRTILLVDDEEPLRTIGSVLLESMGFTAMTAVSGREALKIYRQFADKIDLILLDRIMPEMDGIETYHELRKMSPHIPVIICSGYGLEEVLEQVGADANTGTIHKPYKVAKLNTMIREMLNFKE